jgi:hypothetical protein
MGLDQYAYSKPSEDSEEQTELAYWRKHNRLQGWMEQLWEDKGRPNNPKNANPMGNFNCIPVELTLSDLEQLEAHVQDKVLPETGGFFFGQDSFSWEDENGNDYEGTDYYYKETDLKFIAEAREAIQKGLKVFYNCWW